MARCGPSSAEFRPSLVHPFRGSVHVGKNWPQHLANLNQFAPMWVKLGRRLAEVGHTWPKQAQSRPTLTNSGKARHMLHERHVSGTGSERSWSRGSGQIRARLATLGRVSAKFGARLPNFEEIVRVGPTRVWQHLPDVSPTFAQILWPKLGRCWPMFNVASMWLASDHIWPTSTEIYPNSGQLRPHWGKQVAAMKRQVSGAASEGV